MLHFTGSSEVDDNGFDLCEEIETIRNFLAPGQHGADAMTCSLSKLTEAGDQLWPGCVNAGSKTLLRLRAQFGIPIFGNQSIFTADGNNYQTGAHACYAPDARGRVVGEHVGRKG